MALNFKLETANFGINGATPVAKQGATTDLKDLLVVFGFLTDSGATPLNLDGGALTCYNIGCRQISITDAYDIVLGTGTGTKIGTSATQKLGFFNKSPVVQPTTYTQTYSTGDKTIDALVTSAYTITSSTIAVTPTNSTPWGYGSEAEAQALETQINNIVADVTGLKGKVDNLITDITDCKQAINSLIDDLQALGLVA